MNWLIGWLDIQGTLCFWQPSSCSLRKFCIVGGQQVIHHALHTTKVFHMPLWQDRLCLQVVGRRCHSASQVTGPCVSLCDASARLSFLL